MRNQKINPEKVTRPIQLLAAWLVGLVTINGTFLAAAASFNQGEWERSALTIAAIVNVPIFLVALFLLQTKFRAELQEDSFYYQYLNKKTNKLVSIRKESPRDVQIIELKAEIKSLREMLEQQRHIDNVKADDWGNWRVSINDFLSDFAEIRSELKRNHIPLVSIFGSTSEDPAPPSAFIVSINSGMDFKATLKLLRILSKFRLDGYQYFLPNEVDSDDVYIGAYGYEAGEYYYPFSQEFKEFIKKDIERVDLSYFENKVIQSTHRAGIA